MVKNIIYFTAISEFLRSFLEYAAEYLVPFSVLGEGWFASIGN
jgi:hypothetical protein